MNRDLIRIRDLYVRFGDVTVLNGLSCTLERGKISALIGPNGSGKTTLLKSILKEVPYRGSIDFCCGHDHTHGLPRHIGYVPQKLNVDAKMPITVRDLMALALLGRRPLFFGVSRAVNETMTRLLGRVFDESAKDILAHPVEKISGGELQRVLLALALHPEPELLLLDEPAQGIDKPGQEKFYNLIGNLNRDTGVTIVLVSHELNVVSAKAHHVLCLKDGRIECQGPPGEVMKGDMLAKVFGQDMSVYSHHHHHQ